METRRSNRLKRVPSNSEDGRQPIKKSKNAPTRTPLCRSRNAQSTKISISQRLLTDSTHAASGLNADSIVFRLPRELFDIITDFLPVESLVLLSLTCKSAVGFIGTSCWISPEIRGRGLVSRLQFMECLLRDAPPKLTFCPPPCNTFHPPLRSPTEHCETKLTKTCMGQAALIDYIPQLKDDPAGPGYNLVFPHIDTVFSSPDDTASLSGKMTSTIHERFTYTLESSASWINGSLVLQHSHCFSPKKRSDSIRLSDILSLPIQLCPHQSTTTEVPRIEPRYTTQRLNSSFLTHAVATAFPASKRTAVPLLDKFRALSPRESEQMAAADRGEDVIWRC